MNIGPLQQGNGGVHGPSQTGSFPGLWGKTSVVVASSNNTKGQKTLEFRRSPGGIQAPPPAGACFVMVVGSASRITSSFFFFFPALPGAKCQK